MEKSLKTLNSNQIKLIALMAMTLDHLVCVIAPNYPREWYFVLAHIIGRIAAPVFWFFIAEGYHQTRSLKKYALRLFAFSVPAHFAYNFAFGIPFVPFQTSVFNQTSVMWSLAWGVAAIWTANNKSLKQWQKIIVILIICAVTFPSDWSCIAVLAIMGIEQNRGNILKQTGQMMFYVSMYALVYVLFIDKLYGIIQLFVILAVPLWRSYNGERGRWKGMKWFFYFYYIGHLVICGVIRILLYGNIGVMIGG